MAGRLSLAEQIAQLEQPAPTDFDPEDIQSHGLENELNDSSAREHYLDVGPGSLRKLQHSISDPKYDGVLTSRKQFMEDSGSDPSEADEVDEDIDMDHQEEEHQSEGESQSTRSISPEEPSLPTNECLSNPEPSESEGEAESDDANESLPSPEKALSTRSADEKETAEDVTSSLKNTREADLKKGQAVKRQIAVWDTLLDSRIRLQKAVIATNKLPPPDKIKAFTSAPQCQDALTKFLHEASLFAEDLFDLQNAMLTVNELATPPPRKRRKIEQDTSLQEYERFFEEATEDAAILEQTLHPHLLQTLSKWSSKIQAVAPSVLLPSNKGTFSKGKQQPKSAVQLIEETLADHGKLLERTQVIRGTKERVGINFEPDVTTDPDIFDDTDFYQKMLRDVIDARGNPTGGSEDWMTLQKRKKAKKVDTKASKGRKLRYEVHEKLQNFMVSVPVPGAWHDEQADELFASILGKGFENIGINVEESAPEPVIELGGFRVFG